MDHVSINIEFQWTVLGNVAIDAAGKLVFPKVKDVPGLYRFDISYVGKLAAYIGETERLQRRLQHYRTPGKTQQTNLRLRDILVAAIHEGSDVTLSIVIDGITARLDHSDHRIELTRKLDRTLLEHAAILQAHAGGFAIINA